MNTVIRHYGTQRLNVLCWPVTSNRCRLTTDLDKVTCPKCKKALEEK